MANVKRLPDAYYKGKDGNNYKLLHLNELAINELNTDTTEILNSLDIMQATGKTLDLYGETVQQKRGALNDEQYRLMILTKIGRNICQGDYNSIMRLLIQMFDCEQGDIILKESNDCTITIEKFPLEVLINAGFSSKQAIQMIEMLLPICVSVSDGNFEGTFEFADFDDEYDEEKGFGNIEQTIGGYLGLTVDDKKGFELPI